MAAPAAAGRSAARRRHAPEKTGVTGGRVVANIELTPHYSTRDVPGRCVKCLAEGQYDDCLRSLLRGEKCQETEQAYEALVSFLKSPESRKLREESERLLADGKRVTIRISTENGQPKYELRVNE